MAKSTMSPVRLGIGIIMLVVFVPALAGADIWRFTSEWLDFSWNVSGTETYDDNIFNSATNEEDDFITSLGFNTRFIIKHPFGQFNLSYRFYQSLYLDHDELNDVGSFAGFGQNQHVSFDDSLRPSRRDVITYFVEISRSPEVLHLAGRERRSNRCFLLIQEQFVNFLKVGLPHDTLALLPYLSHPSHHTIRLG